MEPVAPSQRSLRTRRPLRNTRSRDTVAFEGQARSDRYLQPRPASIRDDGGRAIRLVTRHRHAIRVQNVRDLRGDDLEDRGRGSATRDQRCHAPQRRLLLREPRRLRPRLGVRDRRRDQLGELLDARRGFRGQRLGLPRQGNHGAPESAFDDDRRADRRANAYAARPGRDRARRIRVIVEPRRPPRPMHAGGDALPFQRHAGADRNADVRLAPDCDDGGNAVRFEAVLERVLDAQ